MLIGGMDETAEISASTRSFDPDMWTDDLVKLPPYLHKPLPTSLAYASVGNIDRAVILCGGIGGPSGTATNQCRYEVIIFLHFDDDIF